MLARQKGKIGLSEILRCEGLSVCSLAWITGGRAVFLFFGWLVTAQVTLQASHECLFCSVSGAFAKKGFQEPTGLGRATGPSLVRTWA